MRKTLYIAVFTSGMASLAVEMAASRLLGNFFGTSNLVWASIIGLIMIYLTLGYWLGGAWADRSPDPKTFFKILLWAGLSIGIVPVVSRPVLRISAQAFDQLQLGALFGSFTAVLILFVIPVTLLGTTSPFAIRLAIQDSRAAGSVSGHIYAISTLGSFLGTFLPVLVLIPLVGTYRTFLCISLILIVVVLFCFWHTAGVKAVLKYSWMPLLIIVLYWFGLPGGDKTTSGQVYETDSAYNYIQVLDQQGYTMLRLNEGQGIHSIYSPTVINFHGPWEQVLVAPFFNKAPYDLSNVKSMAIVGLAAGTTARQATAVYPSIAIDGYEIDPKIVDVGRKYFDMNEPNLNVIIQDGRVGLSHSTKHYQIISVDAYRPPYIPWQMTTREFFQIVKDHLTTDGVMVINVGRAPNDRRLIDAMSSTISSVFPSLYIVDIPDTFNSIIFASMQPTQATNLIENFNYLSQNQTVHPLLLETLQVSVANLKTPTPSQVVFTDDKAPIEWITNNMVLNFLLSGETETLQ
jgi:spermidine synthase